MSTHNQHPYDLVLAALRAHGQRVREEGPDRSRATCPAHDDHHPSLVITRAGDKVLLKCFRGCPWEDVIAALGIAANQLFVGPAPGKSQHRIDDIYDYVDRVGTAVQKVRFFPKGFRWRHADPTARGGWRWGLPHGLPGLYRADDLTDARRVFLLEGEKAVKILLDKFDGWTATCPPAGAPVWNPEWSDIMVRRIAPHCLIVILGDNDPPGRERADRAAEDLEAHRGDGTFEVRLVHLPGLPPGGDVVDWLEAGHSPADLLDFVAATPRWEPGLRERLRAQRKREQAKVRMRAYRARGRALDQRPGSPTAAPALTAIVAVLKDEQPLTGRAIVERVRQRTGLQRRAIDGGLTLGSKTGQIGVTGGAGRGKAKYYRLSGRTITEPGSLPPDPDVQPGSTPRQSAPVQLNSTEGTDLRDSSEKPVSRKTVTQFAVTQHVRTSSTLQESGSTRSTAEVPAEQQRAIDEGRCCGTDSELRCKLCRWSSRYWRSTR